MIACKQAIKTELRAQRRFVFGGEKMLDALFKAFVVRSRAANAVLLDALVDQQFDAARLGVCFQESEQMGEKRLGDDIAFGGCSDL